MKSVFRAGDWKSRAQCSSYLFYQFCANMTRSGHVRCGFWLVPFRASKIYNGVFCKSSRVKAIWYVSWVINRSNKKNRSAGQCTLAKNGYIFYGDLTFKLLPIKYVKILNIVLRSTFLFSAALCCCSGCCCDIAAYLIKTQGKSWLLKLLGYISLK